MIWLCPRCQTELQRRTNRKTKQAFYGCGDYPACTYTCSEQRLLEVATQLYTRTLDDLERSRDELDGARQQNAALEAKLAQLGLFVPLPGEAELAERGQA